MIQSTPEQVADLLTKGMAEEFKLRIRDALWKQAEAIVEDIAKELARGVSGNVRAWRDLGTDSIQVTLTINNKKVNHEA